MAKNKTEIPRPKSIVLTRKQIVELAAIANHFADVEVFNIEETYESGIGATVRVKCTLFEKPTSVDITDMENW
jgi:hypothetical protein